MGNENDWLRGAGGGGAGGGRWQGALRPTHPPINHPPLQEKGGLAVTMMERVFRTPGCGGAPRGRCRAHAAAERLQQPPPEPHQHALPSPPTLPPPFRHRPPIPDVLPGQFMLQNLCSLTAAHVLAPPPGARVLDMCAAPGGKTTALAQLMRDTGEVRAGKGLERGEHASWFSR